MQYTSLDRIVRSVLNQNGLTMHWYFPFLKLAADCLRDQHFDRLRVVQCKKLEVDTRDRSVPLPCDYLDWVKVGVEVGQMVRPLVQMDSINRLNNYDENGQITTYGRATEDDYDVWNRASLDITHNIHGEHIGRLFNFRTNNSREGFKEIRERGVIQLSEEVSADYIILEYISDGTQLVDAASKINPYATRTIETYIEWKKSPNRNNIYSPEADQHFAAAKILRARMNPLTVADYRRIIKRNRQATGR